jgi:hypothetical protein
MKRLLMMITFVLCFAVIGLESFASPPPPDVGFYAPNVVADVPPTVQYSFDEPDVPPPPLAGNHSISLYKNVSVVEKYFETDGENVRWD